jgi:hypothetical protein
MFILKRFERPVRCRIEIDHAHLSRRITWRARWREAVHRTAGIAAYLPDGADYVERLREVDARRLQELDR